MTNTVELSARIMSAATTGNVSALAAALADALVTDTRTSTGQEFVKFADLDGDAADIATRTSRAAHGDAMPNDWVYSQLGDVLTAVSEDEEDATVAADVYKDALVSWLADGPGAVGEVDEYIEEFGTPSTLLELLQFAQGRALDRMCADVFAELDSIAAEYNAGDPDDLDE